MIFMPRNCFYTKSQFSALENCFRAKQFFFLRKVVFQKQKHFRAKKL